MLKQFFFFFSNHPICCHNHQSSHFAKSALALTVRLSHLPRGYSEDCSDWLIKAGIHVLMGYMVFFSLQSQEGKTSSQRSCPSPQPPLGSLTLQPFCSVGGSVCLSLRLTLAMNQGGGRTHPATGSLALPGAQLELNPCNPMSF